jgi:DNA-binding LytR/AlgR family response regulator
MIPLKIGIVEDDLLIAESIFVALQQIGYTPIRPCRTYDDAIKMLQSELPDLVLIDIRIDGNRDGIDLANTINQEFSIPFIFLTANSDVNTISRAKTVKPGAYLLKPFSQNDLFTAIEIAFSNFNDEKNEQSPVKKFTDFIFIKEGDIFYKINLKDILYVGSENVYLNIHTSSKTYVVRNKLESFINAYAHHNFVRVHRSYAINVIHLESVSHVSVKVGGKEVPLNHNYKQDLLNMINPLK